MWHLAELNRTGTVLLHWYYHHAELNQGLVNLAVTAFVNSLVVICSRVIVFLVCLNKKLHD